MRFISVDLPEPEGPMMATYSLWRMRMSTPRRAWTLLVAHLVGLPEIVGDDDVAGVGAVGVGADAVLRGWVDGGVSRDMDVLRKVAGARCD